MADQAPAQVEQTSQTTAAPTPGAENLQPDIAAMSLEQVEAILEGRQVEVPAIATGDKKTTAATPEPTETQTAESGEKSTQAEGEKAETGEPAQVEGEEGQQVEGEAGDSNESGTQGEAEAEEEDDDTDLGPKRIRLKGDDRLIASLVTKYEREGKSISWAEAERRIKGDPVEETQSNQPQRVDYVGNISAIESEIATLQSQLSEFEGGIVTKDLLELQDKLAERKLDLREAKRELQDAARSAEADKALREAKSDERRDASHSLALAEYPDLADKRTPLGKAVAQRVVELQDRSHPDHSLLYQDNCPLLVARLVAGELGVLAKPKNGKVVAKQVIPTPKVKAVPPVPGNKTQVPAKPAGDVAAQVETLKREATLEDLDRISGADQSNLLAGVI